jgi:hypothetical protein
MSSIPKVVQEDPDMTAEAVSRALDAHALLAAKL